MVQSTRLAELRSLFVRLGLAPPVALLATLAGGCGDKDVDEDEDQDDSAKEELCEEAATYGYTGADAEVFCDLHDYIEDSGLPADDKQTLVDCLNDLYTGTQREQLLETFQTASDEELEQALLMLLDECDGGDDGGDEGTH